MIEMYKTQELDDIWLFSKLTEKLEVEDDRKEVEDEK